MPVVPITGKVGVVGQLLIDEEDMDLVANNAVNVINQPKGKGQPYAVTRNGGRGRALHILIGRRMGITNFIRRVGDGPFDVRRASLLDTGVGTNRKKPMKVAEPEPEYIGVRKPPRCQYWIAEIRANGGVETIGRYARALHAAKAYDRRALEIFGNTVKNNGTQND